MKKKLLLTSILSIMMCFSLLVGATFALFTSESKVNIAVTSGTVSVTATVTNIETGSNLGQENKSLAVAQAQDGTFEISGMVPGDFAEFTLTATSASNVDILYRVANLLTGDLAPALDVEIQDGNGTVLVNDYVTNWESFGANKTDIGTYIVKITFVSQDDAETVENEDNAYMNKTAKLALTLEAVQGNAPVSNPLDITTDVNGDTTYSVNDKVGMARFVNTIVKANKGVVDGNIELGADIDMSGIEWMPIEGTYDGGFYDGIFDGNGYTISNLTLEGDTPAFIAYLAGDKTPAVVKNLTLENVSIIGEGSSSFAAGVVYYAAGNVEISNVTVSGSISGGYAGGIVSYGAGTLKISNCVNNATVVSSYGAGGIGAWVYGVEIENCVNNGDITGKNRAGGLFGNFYGTMSNCVNNGQVVSNGGMPAGGIVAVPGGKSTYNNCVNYGNVINKSSNYNVNATAAGILGQVSGNAATINYCENYGNITAENSVAAGIVVSLHNVATVNYCYNAGTISGAYGAEGISSKGLAVAMHSIVNNCLNAGVVIGEDKVNNNSAIDYTNSYTYVGADLFNVNDMATVVTDLDAVLAVLNGGANANFFEIANGKIVVKA